MSETPKLLSVRVYGDALLRMKALPVRNFDEKLQKIVRDMLHTMYERDGIGLAATQVGFNQRLFVIDMDYSHEDAQPNPEVLINPIIKAGEGEYEMEEGCLSVPGIYAKVKRFNKISYTYYDAKGEEHAEDAEGYKAVVIQHEYDHLNGILFIDKISKLALLKIKRKLKDIMSTAVDGTNIREDIYNPDLKQTG
jgi:peptide deformylase